MAEMLYSSTPFMDSLGIDVEWVLVHGTEEFYGVTKSLHNLFQGQEGPFTPEMEDIYFRTIERCAAEHLSALNADVVWIHDPQPLGLARYIQGGDETWLWRCHIDLEPQAIMANDRLWSFLSDGVSRYRTSIFSSANEVMARWPVPNFVVPPSIDPLSGKNRELDQEHVEAVLTKYGIDPRPAHTCPGRKIRSLEGPGPYDIDLPPGEKRGRVPACHRRGLRERRP